MKKHKNTIIALAIGCMLGVSSCEKILDLQQESEITSASMWKSEGDFKAAVNGMYVNFREAFATNQLFWGDLRSGLYGGGKIVDVGHANIMNNTIYRDNAGTDWTGLYTTINTANLIIKYANLNLIDGALKNEVLAEAHFVRAYCYFWIGRIWGDAPVLLQGFESDKQADLFPSRLPAAEVFKQVEQDINTAEAVIGTSKNDKVRSSYSGLQMLKADYYLWKGRQLNGGNAALQVADQALDKVLASSHQLQANFADVFNVNNERNSEIIFSINLQRDEYVGGFASWYLIPNQYLIDKSLIENPVKIGSAQQYISLTDQYNDLVNAVDTDTRIRTSVMNVTENNVLHRWINKFPGEWVNNTRFFSSNIPVYRLSEAYLMKAEIQNELNNTLSAIGLLNKVAERAYKVTNYYPESTTKSQAKNLIIDEYLKEFVSEGKTWFVFVRNQVAFERVTGLNGKEQVKNILIWPITSASINNNPNMKQTEGYN